MFKQGDIVEYKSNFGNGVVTKVNGTVVRVRFPKFGNSEHDVDAAALKLIERSEVTSSAPSSAAEAPSGTQTMAVGSIVEHPKFGVGSIINIGKDMASVAFSDKTRLMSVAFLSLKKEEHNDTAEETTDSLVNFQIIPSSYSTQPSFSSKAKNFLSSLKRHFQFGFASARPPMNLNGSTSPTLGVIAVPDKGVAVFKCFEATDENDFRVLLSSGYLKRTYLKEKEDFFNHFLESKRLCSFIDGYKKVLKFPLSYFYYFASVGPSPDLLAQLQRDDELGQSVFLMDGLSAKRCGFFANPKPSDPAFKNIPANLYGNILERVIPENVTIFVGGNTNTPVSSRVNETAVRFSPITGSEKEFVALRLDDEQIRIINRTEPGHHLTLANPGTGKSVLLLSKAFRLVSTNEKCHVWVTCYNRNLADKHYIFSQVSGLTMERLVIRTFFDQAFRLLQEFAPDLITRVDALKRNDDKYNRVAEDLLSLLERGEIKPMFDAILVDEVQLFEPKWLRICYKLLKPGQSIFELYGDLNQNVRSSQSKRKASWQSPMLGLVWRGRTHYITKNYRNSSIINQYLRHMLFSFNRLVDDLGVDPANMESVAPDSEALRKGKYKVKIIHCDARSLAAFVKKEVRRMKAEWGADYSEIAILFPAGKLSLNNLHYRPLDTIIETLSNAGISSSTIYGEDSTNLLETNGVVISTIDSALGLDFKYVILCGTYYWNYFWDGNEGPIGFSSKVLFQSNSAHHDAAVEFFIQVGRKIYSACSRARDGLTIIDDSGSLTPFQSLFCPNDGKDYYE